MSTVKKEIVFFIRAYNDIDIQLSLIREFAIDDAYLVRVIFYPADGFITHHDAHEATKYMQEEHNVIFENILQNPKAPFILRRLYAIQNKIRKKRKDIRGKVKALFFKVGDVLISKIMRSYFVTAEPWLLEISKSWNPSIIVTDEIQFQPNRSCVIDFLLPALKEKGAVTYAILTGHRVYKDVYPSGEPKNPNTQKKQQLARLYFVPSEHNKEIYTHLFPSENIVVGGNLRMDKAWIETLNSRVINKAQLPEKDVKVVMMLSKMNYGVEAQNIKDTIRVLGAIPNIALAVKPHTRGMKFDFMSGDEIGHAHIVDKIPSSSLIEWGNVILMTGSSIVFHAMVMNKHTGFLKYCQNLETIFDDGKACKVYNSLTELQQAIKKLDADGFGDEGRANSSFIKHEVHGGVDHGQTAKNHKDMIETDHAKFLARQ